MERPRPGIRWRGLMVACLATGVPGACSSRAARAPAPPVSDVCDVDRWKAAAAPAPWIDSLVPERDLDAPLSILSIAVLGETPPPGWAILGVAVSPRGRVEVATVMASSSPEVEPFARARTVRSRFEPPRREGRAVWAFGCRMVELNAQTG